MAQNATNPAKAMDQQMSWMRVGIRGSIQTGYAARASRAPAFESAKSREGCAPGYQLCSSGLVAERRKYGKPRTAVSRPRIRHVGSSPLAGFQKEPGITGSNRSAAASNPTWRIIWYRDGTRRARTWA